MEITQHPRTTTQTPAGVDELPPVGPVRRWLAGLAVLAALPYLVLKVSWLAGARVGLTDPDFGQGPAMLALNALTLLLDVVALGLAVVFLTRRGLRAPAWLVLPPMWIGAGLLGQILVALPLSLVLRSVNPSEPGTGERPPIEEWVLRPDVAETARADHSDLVILRYDTAPLAERIWSLRHQYTSDDAAYLALAEALGAPLHTCDATLASGGHQVTVQVHHQTH